MDGQLSDEEWLERHLEEVWVKAMGKEDVPNKKVVKTKITEESKASNRATVKEMQEWLAKNYGSSNPC